MEGTDLAGRLELPRPTIVCLCGSTRFREAFVEANLHETLAGRIVLTIGADLRQSRDMHAAYEGVISADVPEVKARLDELHFRKIELADEILVLNCDGYMGESTRNEVRHAMKHRKRIRWLFPDMAPNWYQREKVLCEARDWGEYIASGGV